MKTSEKVIVIDPDKCVGCHSCEMACSMQHYGKCSPLLSRIRIQEFREVNTFIPITCQSCEAATCMKVCPMGARIRLESGAVVTNEEACIGCRACTYSCFMGAPVVNPENGKTMTCDHCGGNEEPWCVRACTMNEALKFMPKYQSSNNMARKFAAILKEEYKLQGSKDEKTSGFSFA